MNKHLLKRSLTLVLAFMLVLTSALPAWGQTPLVEQMSDTPVAPAMIAEDVRTDMANESVVEVLVYLKDKLDVDSFAAQATSQYSSSQRSDYEVQRLVRRDLVNALQDKANTTQRRLINLLENSDEVSEYQDFFITNLVYVKAAPSVIEEIAALPEVAKIEKSKTHYLDPTYDQQEVAPTEDEVLWHLQMVKADEAWALGFDGTGAVVGLIDSGVQWDHPALKNAWRGYDAATDTTNPVGNWLDTVAGLPLPVDSDNHGTHVTGTMVGRDPETGYTTGVAPGAKFIAARVFNELGSTTDPQLIAAGEFMIAPAGNSDLAPDVVNNSWGGGAVMDDWFRDVVRGWVAGGIFPAVAAGNQRLLEPIPQPGSVTNPGNYPESFAVGAIDINKVRAEWSKRGPSIYGDETVAGWKPNISAPGVNIISTVPGGYGSNSGTSMATPHVSGVVALMRSANSSVTLDEIYEAFYSKAEPLIDNNPYDFSPNHDYGYGLINAVDSIGEVAGGAGFFTGKVLRAGSDSGAPVIEHEQEVTNIYIGAPVRIKATITDDTSIIKAILEVTPAPGVNPIEIPMQLVEGDHTGGQYEATITPEMMQGDVVSYRILAEDFAGNQVWTDSYTLTVDFGVLADEYVEGFEGAYPGWILDQPWEVGTPTLETEPAAYEGSNVLATVIGGNYTANLKSTATSPPLDLREVDQAMVKFKHWHQFGITSALSDYGRVYVSTDFGQTKTELATFIGNQTDWQEVAFDLTPYAGNPTPVYLYFEFTSNASLHYHGWYIDQFELIGTDTQAPAVPMNLEATGTLHGVRLTWDDVADTDLAEYVVYRSTEAGTLGEEIARTSQNEYDDRSITDPTIMYYYTVKAVDFFGNMSDASNQANASRLASSTIVLWDFEADNGGFTIGDDTGSLSNHWEWGSVDPNHGPGGTRDGSDKLWGTGLAVNYERSARAWIRSPEVPIPTEGITYLSFDHWYHFEMLSAAGQKWDWGQVQINVPSEGEEWVNITPPDEDDIARGVDGRYGGPINEADARWHEGLIELPEEYRGKTVQIRFYYYTDSSGFRAGWFVDNVAFISAQAVVGGSVQTPMVDSEWAMINTGAVIEADEAVMADEATTQDFDLAAVPALNATVTSLETGVTVRADNRTGDYRMRHKISEGEPWTLKAEAYGYKPAYFSSELEEGHTVYHTFMLEPEETGRIEGRVYDRYFGDPAAGAVVRILEDPNIAPVVADANGNYVFESVYIGDYTLYAVAEGFEPGTAEVTVVADQTVTADIPLKKFIGMPGEIIYDEDNPSNALVLNTAGNGLGVRFTPDGFGKLLSAKFYFWDSSWPTPGGNSIGFGVFDWVGESSVSQIGETVWRDDIERGAWNTVDLSQLDYSTDSDFAISTIQNDIGGNSPGLGIDEAGAADRSYMFLGTSWQLISAEGITGGLMIRAMMEYAAEVPLITNLEAENYVNTDYVDVEGYTAYTEGIINIYVNDEVVVTIPPEELDGNTFSVRVPLTEEVNVIKASLVVNEQETEPSEEVVVIVDQIDPVITVTNPQDGDNLNVELVHVTGNLVEEYLESFTINGQAVTVDEEGNFTTRVILDPGPNTITLVAVDKAGNRTEETLTVHVGLGDDLTLTNLQPSEDVTLRAGETVVVAFNGPSGGTGTYQLTMPLMMDNVDPSALGMIEVEPGYYEATWQAPADVSFVDASVQFQFVDQYGNQALATAPGKITLVIDDPVEPTIERVAGDNRFETAVEMSKKTFASADTVILANGYDFPDALVGGIYAESLNAPVLLTEKDSVPTTIMAEIARLGATDVKVLGGNLVISDAVVTQLEGADLNVERIAGDNRFLTAIEISRRARSTDSNHVFLVSAQRFPDALSIVPVAAMQDHSILLSNQNSLDAATLQALQDWGTRSVTIMGGESVIGRGVVNQLDQLGISVERQQGPTRYATNIVVAETYFVDPTAAVGASGENFPDALVATVYAALNNQPIILVHPDGLELDTSVYLRDSEIVEMTLMGGPLVIPPAVELEILQLLKQ